MPVNPTVGRAGGQKYDVAKAIRTFLEQMAGGAGFSLGGAVIKELIQNADDAGATELVVALDERSGDDLPTECREIYGPLLAPSLLVCNDASFRIVSEVPPGDQDDFTAICEVAGGHKRFNPTAAGRFGIGFNSVYFLTDTPIFFSRREVHLFDLRHLVLAEDGWRFSLDEFPAAASNAGPIKTVLEWALPKAVLGDLAFQQIATTAHDYRRTVFRLPLRLTAGSDSIEGRGPVFQGSTFPGDVDRRALLRQMCDEARRSLLFLKSLRRVVFGGLAERRFVEWVAIEATRQPFGELEGFVRDVHAMRTGTVSSGRRQCSFRTDVAVRVTADRLGVPPGRASYQVTHVADFTKPEMNQIMLALGQAMDEPEDLLQLVLGMTSPALWRELFVEGREVPKESLAQWFDHRTAQFGNRDVVKTVQDLIGNCARFDFQEVSDQLPKVDLPALQPFFTSMLRLNRRRVEQRDDSVGFRTPDTWLATPGVLPSYEGLVFRRQLRGREEARHVLGVGHKVMNEALRQARDSNATVATLPADALSRPLVVLRIRDKVTGEQRAVRSVSIAVEIADGPNGTDLFLKDWELLERLNGLVGARGFRAPESIPPVDLSAVEVALERGMSVARESVLGLGLPFRFPEVEPVAVLWPVPAAAKGPSPDDDEDADTEAAEQTRPAPFLRPWWSRSRAAAQPVNFY